MPDKDVLYWECAPFYEALYREKVFSGDGAAQECDVIEKILLKHGGAVSSVIDMGCGTGVHAIELANRGYEVLAADYAEGMLGIAKGRPRNKEANISFLRANMREYVPPKRYDALICMTNAFLCNYKDEHVDAALRCFAASLRSGGVLLIEATSYGAMIANGIFPFTYVNRAIVDSREVVEISENEPDEENRVLREQNTYFIANGKGSFERHDSENRLRMISISRLKQRLSKAGFSVLELIDAETLKTAAEDTSEYFIVCQRA